MPNFTKGTWRIEKVSSKEYSLDREIENIRGLQSSEFEMDLHPNKPTIFVRPSNHLRNRAKILPCVSFANP